jgi:hypothetical protein
MQSDPVTTTEVVGGAAVAANGTAMPVAMEPAAAAARMTRVTMFVFARIESSMEIARSGA